MHFQADLKRFRRIKDTRYILKNLTGILFSYFKAESLSSQFLPTIFILIAKKFMYLIF